MTKKQIEALIKEIDENFPEADVSEWKLWGEGRNTVLRQIKEYLKQKTEGSKSTQLTTDRI